MNIHKVKRNRNSDTQNRHQRTTKENHNVRAIALERSVINYWGLKSILGPDVL